MFNSNISCAFICKFQDAIPSHITIFHKLVLDIIYEVRKQIHVDLVLTFSFLIKDGVQ